MSACETTHYMEHVFVRIVVACAPCTILFNALVLYIAYKFIDLKGKLNQFYVVSMTAADFVYGVNFMATRPFVESIPHWLCRPYYVVNWMCQIASIMFLLFLNVDKFISLTFPLHYNTLITERKVLSQVLVCWAVIFTYAVVSALDPLLQFSDENCPGCNMKVNPFTNAIQIFICYVCPTVISLIISIYIFVLAQHKTRWVPDFPDSKIERRRERKRLFKRIFFVFSSTIWTAVTSLPYRLGTGTVWLCFQLAKSRTSSRGGRNETSNFTLDFVPYENVTFYTLNNNGSALPYNSTTDASPTNVCVTENTFLLIWLFMYILPFGSVGNPVITIITQRAYRQRALFLWSLLLKRLHAPGIFIPTSYISVRRKSKSEDESTKVVEMMSTDDLTSPMPSIKRVSKQNVFELM